MAGLSLLILLAISNLAPYTFEAISASLSFWEWAVLFLWTVLMLIAEGYRGFQKGFSPRFAARILYLLDNPTLLRILLSPLFSLGLFQATRRRLLASWSLSLGITLLILIIGNIPQPWRGIIDSGVIAGLAYGLVTIYYFSVRVLLDHDSDTSPEVA